VRSLFLYVYVDTVTFYLFTSVSISMLYMFLQLPCFDLLVVEVLTVKFTCIV